VGKDVFIEAVCDGACDTGPFGPAIAR